MRQNKRQHREVPSHTRRTWPITAQIACAAVVCVSGQAYAAYDLTDGNIGNIPWVVALSGAAYDTLDDQQTSGGSGSPADLVGNAANPLMYWFFDRGTTGSDTDGTLFIRTRLGGTDNKSDRFSSVLLVALDYAGRSGDAASGWGHMDLFAVARVNNKQGLIGVAAAGTGLNTSPSTSDWGGFIGSTTSVDYTAGNSTVYSDVLTGSDLDANNSTDHWVSFAVSFQTVVAAGLTLTPTLPITDTTQFKFGVATATQNNSLNQDAGGGWNESWESIEPPAVSLSDLGVELARGSATNVTLDAIHMNGHFTAKSTTVDNLESGTYVEYLDATVTATANNATTSGSVADLPQAGTQTISTSLSDAATTTKGLKTGTATLSYTSDGVTPTFSNGTPYSNLLTPVGTQDITITGMVYSGLSTWTPATGGSWGGDPQLLATHANWSTDDGAPGTWGASFDNVDTATFGSTLTANSEVTVDSAISVKSITFNNNDTGKGTYTIAPGTGSLTMKSGDGPATLSDTSGRSANTITAPITLQSNLAVSVTNSGTLTVASLLAGTGTQAVEKTGNGTLLLTGDSTYTGTTTVSAGTLQLNGSLGNTAVTVASGATLDGVGGTVAGGITVSGTIAPGNGQLGSISTLTSTEGTETWATGGTYAVDLTQAVAGELAPGILPPSAIVPGVAQDYLVMDALVVSPGFTVKPATPDILPGFAPSKENSIYDWIIGRVTDATSTISMAGAYINTSMFAGGGIESYHFSLFTQASASGGQDVILRYDYNAVPEATTLLLGMAGLTPLLLQRRRWRVTA